MKYHFRGYSTYHIQNRINCLNIVVQTSKKDILNCFPKDIELKSLSIAVPENHTLLEQRFTVPRKLCSEG